MKLFNDKYRSNSPRLEVWDYSIPWWYFITTNTKNQKHWFGDIIEEKMVLNKLGRYVKESWFDIPNHYPLVELDSFVIMPNHIHGIIIISEKSIVRKDVVIVDEGHAPHLQSGDELNYHTLSNIVGSFKSEVTKLAHKNRYKGFGWQRSFYDRIIRNEKELYNIQKYIQQNPLKWLIEKELPENLEM